LSAVAPARVLNAERRVSRLTLTGTGRMIERTVTRLLLSSSEVSRADRWSGLDLTPQVQ
jgi:hypothetical protein